MSERIVKSINFTWRDLGLLEEIEDLQRLEGWTFSRLSIEALKEFVSRHRQGNPQTRLVDKPVVKDLRKHSVTEDNPMLGRRRYLVNSLEATLNANPNIPKVAVMKAFAKETGLKLETVQEYMRVLGRRL